MLRIILTIVFVLLCIAMTVIVLMQEGKSAGLGCHQRCSGDILGQK